MRERMSAPIPKKDIDKIKNEELGEKKLDNSENNPNPEKFKNDKELIDNLIEEINAFKNNKKEFKNGEEFINELLAILKGKNPHWNEQILTWEDDYGNSGGYEIQDYTFAPNTKGKIGMYFSNDYKNMSEKNFTIVFTDGEITSIEPPHQK